MSAIESDRVCCRQLRVAATALISMPLSLLVVAGLLSLATSGLRPAWAQPASKIFRVGLLSIGNPESGSRYQAALRGRLLQLGYREGSNLLIEARYAGGNTTRLPALAAELVDLKVNVIVAGASPAVDAVRRATRDIPIVMVTGDPVTLGFVRSLAHPDGNLTGVTTDTGPALWTKRLQLLKRAAPNIRRVGVLSRTGGQGSSAYFSALERGARELGLVLIHAGATRSEDLAAAFTTFSAQRVDALLILEQPLFLLERRAIIEFAAKHHLPDIHGFSEAPEDGALMAYAFDLVGIYRQVATYVDRLLKGVKSADLPIEQPTHFDLIINNKTARALGLDIAPSLRLEADRMIE